MPNNYKKLNAWKSARKLCLMVYELTDFYPKHEVFSIVSQTTRAAVSIPANIAEGSSRSSKKDFAHFLEIALGSLFELETLIDIALERKYFSNVLKQDICQLLEETVKLIYGLKRSLTLNP